MSDHKNFWVFLCIFFFYVNGLHAQDSLSHRNQKQQIGFDSSRILKLLEADENTFDLNYRLAVSEHYSLRAGLSYFYTSRAEGELDTRLRFGVDYIFKQHDNWDFYTGGDILFSYEGLDGHERRTTSYGFSPVLGFLYRIGDHFSLSVEPRLLFNYNRFIDEDNFGSDSDDKWFEVELSDFAQIQFNFHF
jgi:hypothetical protein